MLPTMRLIATGVGAAVCLSAIPAIASVAGTIYLSAHVPVYCNVELFPTAAAATSASLIPLGTSQELCNSPRGYRVILDHPSNMSAAAVVSDSVRIPLSDSGETVLWDSDQPGFEQHQLALDLGTYPETVSRLGLRIEVKY